MLLAKDDDGVTSTTDNVPLVSLNHKFIARAFPKTFPKFKHPTFYFDFERGTEFKNLLP
jgi:hypothetical protein